jgi:hypothetical protein
MLMMVTGGGAILLATVALVRHLRKPVSPEEAERRRRTYVYRVGRIGTARILDVVSLSPEPIVPRTRKQLLKLTGEAPAARQIVIYKYEIRGVEYEASQDLTSLTEDPESLRYLPDMTASVKYDPADPGNSIIVCEEWSGLR